MSRFSDELIMIGDILDASGLHSEAAQVDDIIIAVAQDSSVHRAAQNFWDYFRQHVMQEIPNPDSPISEKTLGKLDELAKLVFEKYQLAPHISEKTYKELQPGSAHDLATSILALEENMMEVDMLLERETDPAMRTRLERQKDGFVAQMEKLYEIFDRMASGQGRHKEKDVERAKEIHNILEEKRKKLEPTREQRLSQRVERALEQHQKEREQTQG